jgi:hypothetical protein
MAALTASVLLQPGVAAPPQQPPDLTRGGVKDDKHDWTLGPTGARGWIWAKDFVTTDARQILITKVEKGSPADGVLQPGDVILGVNGRPFDSDARIAFGRAITEAERTRNRGVLRLLRWRAGTSDQAVIRLAALGDYSPTWPANCTKSKRIVDLACRHLMKAGVGDGVGGMVNALGLLAAGRPEYLPPVRELVHKIGPPDLKLELGPGMLAWEWSYSCLLLTEYYLATKDPSVLHAIREYATKIAEGQSAIGTWGHGMSLPQNEGGLGGYGAINQPGLTCWLAMILAQKCGVDDPIVSRAVARSRRFFSFYTGKGSIPYGDHAPFWFLHDNNGKNGLAAVAFDVIGDAAATRFFSRMSTASYAEREFGHTGNYFSYLWGPLGVARSGQAALAAHLNEQTWFYDLARSWDGGFIYQGGPGEQDSYEGWDVTGVFLLTYALPNRKLVITGKGMGSGNVLTGVGLKAVIEAGRNFDYRHANDCFRVKAVAELLKDLSSWSPVVRYRASEALALKKAPVIPRLIAMLNSRDLNSRYGACHALELMGDAAAPAVDALIAQLRHRDQWLQIRAAYALAGIGQAAAKSVPELLRLAMAGTPDDPRQTTRRYIGMALFLGGYVDTGPKRGLLADSVAKVDTDVLIPVLKQMLETDDGLVRAQIGYLYNKLSDKELDRLWPDIIRAVDKGAPSGEMYANEVRMAGVNLLAKHHIKEGIRAIARYACTQGDWASENRTPLIMEALKSYGSAAKEVLPDLRDLVARWKVATDFPDDCNKKRLDAVEEAIRYIEAATEAPPLRSLGLNSSHVRGTRRRS